MRRVNLETEKTSEYLEADELDAVRDRLSAGAFVMNVERERRHRRRERHDRNRDAVVQTYRTPHGHYRPPAVKHRPHDAASNFTPKYELRSDIKRYKRLPAGQKALRF